MRNKNDRNREQKHILRGFAVKKLLKIIAPILVLVVSIVLVQILNAAKPAPEKKEESQRMISLYVDEVKSDMVTLTVQTQG